MRGLFHLDNDLGQMLTTSPPKRTCLGSMDLNTSTGSAVRMHCPKSVAEQSSKVRVGGIMSTGRENKRAAEKLTSSERLEDYFMSGSPLSPVELLVYSLMKIQFKTSTFTKHHSIVQYDKIAEAVSKICGVQFEAMSIRKFFPGVSNNR